MCIEKRYIFTRSRMISPYHRERLLVPCKCGRCPECQTQIRNEYYYRIYHEWISTLRDNGWIFFDTLTYSDEFLPHLSEFWDIPKGSSIDFPCFCYTDVTDCFRDVRKTLGRQGYMIDNPDDRHDSLLKFFLASEYGTSEAYRDDRGRVRLATHRPHYHVLFFSRVPGLTVSHLRHVIDKHWIFGRTDRVRYYGKHANYFKSNNHDDKSSRGVSNYVAKYVQKISVFQHEIDDRLAKALRYIYDERFTNITVTKSRDNIDCPAESKSRQALEIRSDFDNDSYKSFCDSVTGKKIAADMARVIQQFHRQSQSFGVGAFYDMDVSEVMDTGFLTIPDSQTVVKRIPVPVYYERKLFMDQVKIENSRVWQLNALGKKYKSKKEARIKKYLAQKYRVIATQYHEYEDVDFDKLAHYIVYYKGRYNGDSVAEITPEEKWQLPDIWFNYSSPTDKALFHSGFLSREFIGMAGQYYNATIDNAIPIKVFLHQHLITSEVFPQYSGYDKIIDRLDKLYARINPARQRGFDKMQELQNMRQQSVQLALAIADDG